MVLLMYGLFTILGFIGVGVRHRPVTVYRIGVDYEGNQKSMCEEVQK